MGHGTGASLVNFLSISPVAKDLLRRVILLSGSSLSPWGLQREPLTVKRKVAEQTGCHGDLEEEDISSCLKRKTVSELMSVKVDPPRFLPGFAPFVDGSVIPSEPAFEMAEYSESFHHCDMVLGLATTESYLDLSAQDLEFGFNESKRDRVLRTYVRNTYYYHLNEIFSTLKNEYTDWERPIQNQLNVRDSTLEVLSDGHTVAPLIRVGYLHTHRGGRTYFFHFDHKSSETDFPQRLGSVRGEDVPYEFGLPLVGGQPFFPHNYSRQDAGLSRLVIHYIANFARNGNPNSQTKNAQETETENSSGQASEHQFGAFWDTYDPINQLYMELGLKQQMKSHYRGHKMSLWLNLIPQLHRPGGEEVNMRHHHFQEEGPQFYEGPVREQSFQRPSMQLAPTTTPIPTTPPTTTKKPLAHPVAEDSPPTTTECPQNATTEPSAGGRGGKGSSGSRDSSNLLRKLATSHYQSYTTALTVTIAVGCFLLLLNILIFAGIYHQRDRGGQFEEKKEESPKPERTCGVSISDSGSSDNGGNGAAALTVKHAPSHTSVELPLKEFKSSPGVSPSKRNCTAPPPGYSTVTKSPSIPEPPPPPKGTIPTETPLVTTTPGQQQCNQSGILRQQGSTGTMKKRVQIQEISV